MHKHHIIPRHEWKTRFGNLQGFNAPDNVVWLTVEQHAQAHKWLWENTGNKYDRLAWMVLSGTIDSDNATRIASSLAHLGVSKSQETKMKISLSKMGVPLSAEHKRKCSEASKGVPKPWKRGFLFSLESKKKMSDSHKGKRHTQLTKEKMSATRIGKKFSSVMCPVCNKIGGESGMKSWHFNNCKKRG